jgi:flagellar biosynthesis/type III secretory pathway chaperone
VNSNWERLAELFDEIVLLYRTLLGLSKEKNCALMTVSPQNIETITKQEEGLVFRLGKIQTTLDKVMKELMVAYNLNEQASFDELLKFSEASVATRLKDAAGQLKDISKQLTIVTELNATMINQALVLINKNFNLLVQNTGNDLYSARGGTPQPQRSKTLFDSKA